MFAESVMAILRKYVTERHGGVCARASKSLGIANDSLSRWLSGQRSPLEKIGAAIDAIIAECPEYVEGRSFMTSTSSVQNISEVASLKRKIAELEGRLAQSEKMNDKLLKMLSAREPQKTQETMTCYGLCHLRVMTDLIQ